MRNRGEVEALLAPSASVSGRLRKCSQRIQLLIHMSRLTLATALIILMVMLWGGLEDGNYVVNVTPMLIVANFSEEESNKFSAKPTESSENNNIEQIDSDADDLIADSQQNNLREDLEPSPYPQRCDCNGENFCFKGLNFSGHTSFGLQFNCSLYNGLEKFGLLESQWSNISLEYPMLNPTDWSPIFVTSVSYNHFRESRKLFQSIRKHYPASKILIFDIGMLPTDLKEIGKWCNVEVRKFNFSAYPDHVRTLRSFAFKLAIIEVIQTHKTFFYVDASVRVTNRNYSNFLIGVQNGELLSFSTHTFAAHSVFATTHPRMLQYLPLPPTITQLAEVQSTFQFITDAPYTRYILKWWYLCAMTRNCISPPGAQVTCYLGRYNDHHNTYLECHRFDQAYWNIAALAYLFGDARGALQLNYYPANWSRIGEPMALKIGENRNAAMDKFFRLVSIHRSDEMRQPLHLKCHKS